MTPSPAILSLATNVPSLHFTQTETVEQFTRIQEAWGRRARAIFRISGVGHRHAVVDHTFYAEHQGTEARNKRYFEESVPLGEATINDALDEAGLTVQDVDDLIVVSCTGILTPGLDLHLAGKMGMRHDLRRSTILGMGCYGSFPGLLRARESAAAGRTAVLLSLELCSLHLQMDNTTENLLACALFSDGAAAVVVGDKTRLNGHGNPQRNPTLIDSATHCDYNTLDHMAFDLTDTGFRMYLSTYVPDVLAANVEPFIDGLLTRNGLCRDDVAHWGVHPGGRKIIDYMEERLGLPEGKLDHSRRVLHDYGNMSSPTIMFVLDEIQRCADPQPGDYAVLMAFGPGLTMEASLLRW